MAYADQERRKAVTARLSALRDDGSLTPAHLRLAAEGAGVSIKTVRRWLNAPAEPPSRGPVPTALSATDREAFAFYRGNVRALARARRCVVDGDPDAVGATVPQFLVEGWTGAAPLAERTLHRLFASEMTPAERAAWRSGESGRRDASVYLRRPMSWRNETWALDHKQMPIVVLPPRGPAVRPWLTTIVDDGTRAFVGWAIALTPSSATVLTALRMALVHDEARGPFGGVPAFYRVDRGLEFAAEAVTTAMKTLVVDGHRLPAFTPHRKGKVERIHETIAQMLLSGMVGYTKGPRAASGVLYGPVKDSAKARAAAETEGGPIALGALVEAFARWVHWYNHFHAHSELDGQPPVSAWADDPTPVHRIDAEYTRHLLLAGDTRTVQKDGVHFKSLSYVAPELHGRRGQQVEVRFMPHDDRQIEVYLDGKHLCTAFPQGQLSAEQVEAFRVAAREEAKRLGAARRKASARARVALAPMTGGQSSPTQASAAVQARGLSPELAGRDAALHRASSTSLLGLVDPVGLMKKESGR